MHEWGRLFNAVLINISNVGEQMCVVAFLSWMMMIKISQRLVNGNPGLISDNQMMLCEE